MVSILEKGHVGSKEKEQVEPVRAVPDHLDGKHATPPSSSPDNSSRYPNQSSDMVNFQSSIKNAEIDIEAK